MAHNPYQAPDASLDADQSTGAALTNEMLTLLQGARPWTRLLSVVGFLGAGLGVLGGLGMLVMSVIDGFQAELLGMGIAYLLFSLLYVVPALHLHRFSSAMSRMRYSVDKDDLIIAFAATRKFWRFAGISVLTIIALYILAIVGVVIGASFMP